MKTIWVFSIGSGFYLRIEKRRERGWSFKNTLAEMINILLNYATNQATGMKQVTMHYMKF